MTHSKGRIREVQGANEHNLARLVMASAPVQACPFIYSHHILSKAVVTLDLCTLEIWDDSFP